MRKEDLPDDDVLRDLQAQAARAPEDEQRYLARQIQARREVLVQQARLGEIEEAARKAAERVGQVDPSNPSEARKQARIAGDLLSRAEKALGDLSISSNSPLADNARQTNSRLEGIKQDLDAALAAGRVRPGATDRDPSGAALRAARLGDGLSQRGMAERLQAAAPEGVKITQQRVSDLEAHLARESDPGKLPKHLQDAYKLYVQEVGWRGLPISERRNLEDQGERLTRESTARREVLGEIRASGTLTPESLGNLLAGVGLLPNAAANQLGLDANRVQDYLMGKTVLTPSEQQALAGLARTWHEPTKVTGSRADAPTPLYTLGLADGTTLPIMAANAEDRKAANSQIGKLFAATDDRTSAEFPRIGPDGKPMIGPDGRVMTVTVTAGDVKAAFRALRASGGDLANRLGDFWFYRK